tara:strand:+ start:380 stop:1393 length:1014 start_codon:yes stop_codon:yes gene_type:complete
MNQDILDLLKGHKKLSEVDKMEFISTGCYALNKIITGTYNEGIPVGGIVQLRGNSSTGKTLFATTFMSAAQNAGWYVKMLDAENTFSPDWGEMLGIDPKTLLYSTPDSLEAAFGDVENTVAQIREHDKKTPIMLVIDSVAVLPTQEEMDRDTISNNTNTDGARRALIFGSLLRKINSKLKKNRATLIVINQIRNKIMTSPHGNPETTAAGGKALEFYLSVDLNTISNKTSNVLKDGKIPIGIEGRIQAKKNKLGIPFRECDFKVIFDKGLDPFWGLEELLSEDGLMEISSSGRRSIGDLKFPKNDISALLFDDTKSNPELDKVREMFGISLKEATNG